MENHNFFKVKNHKLLLEMSFQRVDLNTKYGHAHSDRFWKRMTLYVELSGNGQVNNLYYHRFNLKI